MQPYALIHPINQFSFLCHHVDRQDLQLLISFRWNYTLDLCYWMGITINIIAILYLFNVLYVQLAASDEKPRQFLSMADNSLDMVLSQVSDSNLRHTLQFGIGLHHAGLNDRDRSLVEELFSNNKIQVCCALIAFSCYTYF